MSLKKTIKPVKKTAKTRSEDVPSEIADDQTDSPFRSTPELQVLIDAVSRLCSVRGLSITRDNVRDVIGAMNHLIGGEFDAISSRSRSNIVEDFYHSSGATLLEICQEVYEHLLENGVFGLQSKDQESIYVGAEYPDEEGGLAIVVRGPSAIRETLRINKELSKEVLEYERLHSKFQGVEPGLLRKSFKPL